jgi:AraC-like DNA-binding protein
MKKGYIFDLGEVSVSYFCDKDAFNDICRSGCHDKYEIIYAVSPLGDCTVEGNSHVLTPRTLLLIPPMSYHNHVLHENVCEGYSVSFSVGALTDRVLPMLDRISTESAEGGRFYSSDCICDSLSDIFRRFEDASALPELEQRAFVETLICEMIIFLSASEGLVFSRTDNELGARVTKYLNANIERNISLDKLAGRFFVSKYHLCRAFKKYSGVSVHSYINHKRIMYAKQLIESGETASGAAERVGYGDYSAFYRAYVRIVGKSPRKN